MKLLDQVERKKHGRGSSKVFPLEQLSILFAGMLIAKGCCRTVSFWFRCAAVRLQNTYITVQLANSVIGSAKGY